MISLIAGLGNPGEYYEGTRHNVGFEVVDRVMSELRAVTQPARDHYEWAVATTEAGEVILAKPTIYMNRSGEAIMALLNGFDMDIRKLLLVVDDFYLPLGAIRIRAAGSDGGHKGLRSVAEVIESQEFARLRLGIGPRADNVDAADFALARFEPEELEKVREMVAKAAEAVIFATCHRLDVTMTRYNTISPAPTDPE